MQTSPKSQSCGRFLVSLSFIHSKCLRLLHMFSDFENISCLQHVIFTCIAAHISHNLAPNVFALSPSSIHIRTILNEPLPTSTHSYQRSLHPQLQSRCPLSRISITVPQLFTDTHPHRWQKRLTSPTSPFVIWRSWPARGPAWKSHQRYRRHEASCEP